MKKILFFLFINIIQLPWLVNAIYFSELVIEAKKIQNDLEKNLDFYYQKEQTCLDEKNRAIKQEKNIPSSNNINLTKILEISLNDLLLKRINNFIRTANQETDKVLRHKDFNKFIDLNKVLIDKGIREKFERNGFKLFEETAIFDSMQCKDGCNIAYGITSTDMPYYFHKSNCKNAPKEIPTSKLNVAQKIKYACLSQQIPIDSDTAFPYILNSLTGISLDVCRIIDQYKQTKIEAFLNFYEILGKLDTYRQIEKFITDLNTPEYYYTDLFITIQMC